MTSIQRRRARLQKHQRARIGLRRRMLELFETNPADDYTVELLALKFGAKPSSVRTELHRLKGEGAVEWASIWRYRPRGEEGIEDRMRQERLAAERAEREAKAGITQPDDAQPSLFDAPADVLIP